MNYSVPVHGCPFFRFRSFRFLVRLERMRRTRTPALQGVLFFALLASASFYTCLVGVHVGVELLDNGG